MTAWVVLNENIEAASDVVAVLLAEDEVTAERELAKIKITHRDRYQWRNLYLEQAPDVRDLRERAEGTTS